MLPGVRPSALGFNAHSDGLTRPQAGVSEPGGEGEDLIESSLKARLSILPLGSPSVLTTT